MEEMFVWLMEMDGSREMGWGDLYVLSWMVELLVCFLRVRLI